HDDIPRKTWLRLPHFIRALHRLTNRARMVRTTILAAARALAWWSPWAWHKLFCARATARVCVAPLSPRWVSREAAERYLVVDGVTPQLSLAGNAHVSSALEQRFTGACTGGSANTTIWVVLVPCGFNHSYFARCRTASRGDTSVAHGLATKRRQYS